MAKKQKISRSEVVTAAAPAAGSDPAWYRDPKYAIAAVLIVAIAVVYGQTFGFDFINLDDDAYVYENAAISHGLSLAAIKWAFTAFYASNWHPLTWLSHAFDVQVFGLTAGGHHAVNVILHAANSVVLFFLVRYMTGRNWESAAVAAIFAIHPTHVESVAWVAERKDVLSTLFWLTSTFAYVRWARNRADKKWYVAALALFAAGLAAKPMLVTLPFTLLLLDYWPLERISKLNAGSVFPLVREKAAFFVLAAASCVITVMAQGAGGAIQSTVVIPMSDRIMNAIVSYATYAAMLFYPFNLGVWYPFESDIGVLRVLLSAAFLLVVTVACFRYGSERRYLLTGWLWFLGTLVPVIGILQVGRQALADRYTYVPFIGLSIAVVWLAAELIGRLKIKPPVVAGIGAAVMLGFTVLAFVQASYWKNTETLTKRTLNVTRNNYLIESNYCNYLEKQNRLDEAAASCTAAITHEPNLVDIYNTLASVQLKQGKFEDARKNLTKSISLNAEYAPAYGNLALVELNEQNIEKAVEYLNEAIRRDKGGFFDEKRRAEGYGTLAFSAMKQKKYDVAADCYKRALDAAPDNADYQRNLALSYKLSGRPDEAVKLLENIIRKNPNSAEACNTLGTLYAEQGRRQEAIAQFQRALQINPNFAPAQANLKKATE